LLITGVVVGSSAYKWMQNDRIRFLDVIEKINDQPVSSLRQSFSHAVQDLPSLRMIIKRPISLPPTSKLLSEIKKLSVTPPPTHIVVLWSPCPLSCGSEFGLTLNPHMQVTGSSKDTPARQCGLKYGDAIQLYAHATAENVGTVLRGLGSPSVGDFQNRFDRALDVAASLGRSLIMVIARASMTCL